MLQELLSKGMGLSTAEADQFFTYWNKEKSLKRNDFLIRKGQVENHLYFVRNGAMRLFYPNGEEEICVGFAYDNNLICSIPSFLENKPSDYYIQALRKTELVGITRSDFYAFKNTHLNFERFWSREIEKALLGRIEREIDLLMPDPAQRLQRLLDRSPHIFQIIPFKYIASYLRMTPETLSRIYK